MTHCLSLHPSSCYLYAGDNDATVILKPAPGSRRWQHVTTEVGAHAAPNPRQTERNYTIILGSHRNTCLKVEKDGQLCEAVWLILSQLLACTTRLGTVDCNISLMQSFARSCSRAVTVSWPMRTQVEYAPGARLSRTSFTRFWIVYRSGHIRVGTGSPGQGNCYTWTDPQPTEGIQHVGLSAWDSHVQYRNIQVPT